MNENIGLETNQDSVEPKALFAYIKNLVNVVFASSDTDGTASYAESSLETCDKFIHDNLIFALYISKQMRGSII